MNEIKLKVMEALQEEAYKGIVRIDSQTMKELGVHPGDVVEIQGNRLTVGIVDRAYPTDVGQNIIRMDGIIRRNAQTLPEWPVATIGVARLAGSLVFAIGPQIGKSVLRLLTGMSAG